MLISIQLQNFRNFKKESFEFSPQTTVIVGPNASGKTNLLESVFLSASGKSFKARVEEEMIAYQADLSRIQAVIDSLKLGVVLTRGEIEVGEEKYEKSPKKKLLVNGISRRLVDFAGNLKVVLFGPWDLDLVTEAPSLRRKFLDTVLAQVDREYRRASLSYEKGLRQRNKLLYRIREELPTGSGNLPRNQLFFWNRLLIKNGDYLNKRRREFIDFVNAGNFQFTGSYFQLDYDPSVISESRLDQYAQEEIAAATTLVGPHRDDFVFQISDKGGQNNRNLASYGSRGEQRMSVLWLKLAELKFVEETTGEKPTLLLDDILSELDHEHRLIVLQAAEKQQTIITTADPHDIEKIQTVAKIDLGQ